MGATLNGMFMWDRLLQKYEANIRKAFRLQDRFLQMANRKPHNIRKTFLKSRGTSTRQTHETKLARRKQISRISICWHTRTVSALKLTVITSNNFKYTRSSKLLYFQEN